MRLGIQTCQWRMKQVLFQSPKFLLETEQNCKKRKSKNKMKMLKDLKQLNSRKKLRLKNKLSARA
jgi:hypothetical protein